VQGLGWNVNNKNKYIAWATVFAASLAAVAVFHFFPVSVVGDLAGVPAIVALFGALFQLSRDNIAFERSARLEEAKNRFTVGVTSHMANVAFDKHVLFCEEYVGDMQRALTTLFREGPTPEALQHANSLYAIRRKWAVWLTPELETDLERFEAAVRKIGAYERLARDYPGELRAGQLEEIYSLFAEVIGEKEWKGEPINGDRAVAAVIGKLRNVLGINGLVHLRNELIERAAQNLK
jgi:hypothetical protein